LNNGFVYVASLSRAYYKAAVSSAISLKDFYPEANITLFTHESFVKDSDRDFFDNIVTGIPVHIRAKMWGMARSPYDKTLYLDCDTEIRSENIKTVFDLMTDKDLMFTKIINHVSRDKMIDDNNRLEYHGGVILYNNSPITIDFMHDWYEYFLKQQEDSDFSKHLFQKYNPNMRKWDQFTVWYLLNNFDKYKDIKHGFFPDGGHSFNFIHVLEHDWPDNAKYKELEQIVYHYQIPGGLVNEGYIRNPPGSKTDFD
jgi:hypothetical protein